MKNIGKIILLVLGVVLIALGEFSLDEKTFIGFPSGGDYEDFDMTETSAKGYEVSKGKTTEGAWTDRWWVTVAGIQQGGTLVAHEKLGAIVKDGVQTKDQLLSSNKSGIIGGAVVFMLIGAVLVVLGIRKPRAKVKAKEA